MLARVAESLYWMGRYIERAEFYKRYCMVEYFSALEAPMTEHQDFTLRSIMYMSGSDFNSEEILTEREVFKTVLFDAANPHSVYSMVHRVRESARGIRNNISSELWESINKWYIFMKSRGQEPFNSTHYFTFFETMRFHVAMIKSDMVHTLLHNDVWHFLNLGMYLERSQQVFKIMRSKISDYDILSNKGENKPMLTFQFHTLLKCLEAFDVHQVHNRGFLMTHATIFELIISNKDFPRSINYTLKKCHQHLLRISERPEGYSEVAEKFESSLASFGSFNKFDSESQVIQHIEDTNQMVTNIHHDIVRLFFQ